MDAARGLITEVVRRMDVGQEAQVLGVMLWVLLPCYARAVLPLLAVSAGIPFWTLQRCGAWLQRNGRPFLKAIP